MTWHLFLDESGDLGFDFENKSPSKYLTISVLAVSQQDQAKAIRNAVKQTLRRKVNGQRRRRKNPVEELKGTRTAISVKRYFYEQVKKLEFGIYALSLEKQQVKESLQFSPGNKDALYNYVARKVIDEIPFDRVSGGVELIVDKSKGKKGVAEFDRYLSSQIRGKLDPRMQLSIHHRSSKNDAGLSAADLFCWGIFRLREREDSEWYEVFAEKVILNELYQ